MSQTTPEPDPDAPTAPLSLDVRFTFATSWNISPANSVSHWPPGGGLDIPPPKHGLGTGRIEIAPVRLAGLSAAEIAQVVRDRAGDMARLAQAIVAADIQFAEALQAAATTQRLS